MAEATADITLERDDGRSIDLTQVSWWTVSAVLLTLLSLGMRMAKLGWLPLSTSEGNRAFQALALFDGRSLAPGEHFSRVDPAMMLGQSGMFFLFGTSDSVARFLPALAGAGVVLLALSLKPFVGRAAAMAMAAAGRRFRRHCCSLSYRRTADPDRVFRDAVPGLSPLQRSFTFALVGCRNGLALGGMLASGPASISVLLCMIVGIVAAGLVDSEGDGAVRKAFGGLRSGMDELIVLGLAFLGTIVLLFSHGLSSVSALRGIPETIANWGRLIVTTESTTPTQFFLLVILLYEILALWSAR